MMIINLGISLLVALFFMLSTKTTVTRKPRKGLMRFVRGRGLRRLTVYFTRFYAVLIRFLCRWRWAVCILLLLGFGLPVFLLPEKLDGEGRWEKFYNETLGSSMYKESVKPVVDKALGGAR